MSESEEILKVLSNEDLQQLRDIYKKYEDIYPHVYSLISTKLKWNEENKNDNLMVFMSPGDSWKIDGTFVFLNQISARALFVFTLDEKCINLSRCLRETRILDFNNNIKFFIFVHSLHHGAVSKFIEERKLTLKDNNPCFILQIPLEEALKFQTHDECPNEVCIKKIDKSFAKVIAGCCPYRYPNMDHHLSSLLEKNGGYGIFLRESDEIVAWIVKNIFGQLGSVNTVETRRRKGYGSLAVKILAEEIARDGFQPLGTVSVNNAPALEMFMKNGFKNIGLCYFMEVDCNIMK